MSATEFAGRGDHALVPVAASAQSPQPSCKVAVIVSVVGAAGRVVAAVKGPTRSALILLASRAWDPWITVIRTIERSGRYLP
jgi:hypothetical protein